MLKTLALIVVAALAAFLLYAWMKPDTFRVARSITIKAPPEAIFPLINDLKRFSEWSPYDKKDPNMQRQYSGPAAGNGATYSWNGDSNVGSGRLVIVDSVPSSKVGFGLDILTPMEAHNSVVFSLEQTADGTQVTWAMDGAVPFFAKIMHTIFNVDRMVGTDFEVGLTNLKALAEKK